MSMLKKEMESTVEALLELAVLTSIVPLYFSEDLTTTLVGVSQELPNL